MRTRYFGWEYVFEHIWKNVDRAGVWDGDDATVAGEFGVTEDEAHEMLSDLANRWLIEHLYPGTYAITSGASGTIWAKENRRRENRCL